MKFRKLKILLPAFIGVLLTTFFVGNSLAQNTPQGFDLTVSPVFVDYTSNPGDKVSDKIRIRNNTTSDMKLVIDVKKLGGDANGSLTLQNPKNDESLSWIEFENKEITAKALEWTDVPFSINIPKEAAFGYYWTINFSQQSTGSNGQTGAKLTGSSAVPVLLNVRKEGAKAEGKILEFKVDPFISEYLPVNFNVKVQNNGNIHIRPIGNIFVRGGGDKDLAILDVNSSFGTIIPGVIREFTASWIDGFIVKEPVMEYGEPKKDKNGQIIEKITINWNKLTEFRIGKYTADLLLVFDDGKKDVTLQATTSFWVFPWKAILVLIGVILGLIIVIRIALKRYISNQIAKRESKET